ncbi:MAG: hypothetical protein ABEI27_08370 [Halobellus sp.]|uniref:DUF7384 family protein n=1 Tax=Halobellus sp. TaxID=1979212 RepID=UPI0035D43653
MESWRALFDRAAGVDADEAAITAALRAVRADEGERSSDSDGADENDAHEADPDETAAGSGPSVSSPAESSPARVVADADVLAADLLVDGDARAALDELRAHTWTVLLASDPLLDDAEAVIGSVADGRLAADWRERVAAWRQSVAQPPGDHPALASAYRGGAMHLLSFDEELRSAQAGATLGSQLSISARHPQAFASLFAPESLYQEVVGGTYPGPDHDPRE